jgi:hypothetical protein
MNRRKWLWSILAALPLAVTGGLVYANSQSSGYTCPLTGECLACADCCPLNCCGDSCAECCSPEQQQ